MINQNQRPAAKAKEPSTDHPQDEHRYNRSKQTYAEAIVQHQVIRQALANEFENLMKVADSIKGRTINKIFILGCGDSWFTGLGVRLAFERLLGVTTEPMQALDFALYYHSAVSEETLAIGISSGGNTIAVMEALHQAKIRGALTIGISNSPGSPITKEFDYSINIDATRKGWPTQASTAAMAVLIQFAIFLAVEQHLVGDEELVELQSMLDDLPEIVLHFLQLADGPMRSLANELYDCRFLFFSGGGPNYASAAFGAAKIKELCPIHAQAIPLEEFHHYRSLKPGDPLILIASDKSSHERALDTAQVGTYDGGKVFALLPEGEQEIKSAATWSLELPSVHPLLIPIVYSVPLHLFAYHLSMAKFENKIGFTPAFP